MKKYIILFVLIATVIGLSATYIATGYYRSTREITITYSDIDSIEIIRSNNSDDTITGIVSGEPLRIDVLVEDYIIKYKASKGYADGEVKIQRFSGDIAIRPAFSDDKLSELYKLEKSQVLKALALNFPNINELYDLESDRLYERGDWFGAILRYKGDSFFNKDDVALVMSRDKKAKEWQIVTNPPLPSVSTTSQRYIPVRVIKSLNSQLHP